MGLLLMASLGLGWWCGGTQIASRKALATTTARATSPWAW